MRSDSVILQLTEAPLEHFHPLRRPSLFPSQHTLRPSTAVTGIECKNSDRIAAAIASASPSPCGPPQGGDARPFWAWCAVAGKTGKLASTMATPLLKHARTLARLKRVGD